MTTMPDFGQAHVLRLKIKETNAEQTTYKNQSEISQYDKKVFLITINILNKHTCKKKIHRQ